MDQTQYDRTVSALLDQFDAADGVAPRLARQLQARMDRLSEQYPDLEAAFSWLPAWER